MGHIMDGVYWPHHRCPEAGNHAAHEWSRPEGTAFCPGIYVDLRLLRDSDSLVEMMIRQRRLQEDSYGFNFDTMTEEERVLFAKDQILALLDEGHEALAEIGWKPWATSRHMNRDAFVAELVDVWHFLMNLLLSARVTPHEFFSLYVAKNEKNAKRQREGYDGVSSKCPACKRAYDDDAVYCTPAGHEGDPSAWCEKKNGHV